MENTTLYRHPVLPCQLDVYVNQPARSEMFSGGRRNELFHRVPKPDWKEHKDVCKAHKKKFTDSWGGDCRIVFAEAAMYIAEAKAD
jgi:hypothetical protein